ncbi:MAG: phage/plasmid primase, P4 family [Clostridiales bacterium]|nr:phage/plasmid primase, P4 family [Clostridiales bacterium]
MTWKGNDRIFKTYIRGNPAGDGKAPAEKIKGRENIRTFQDASAYECFGGLLNEGFIDISFDDVPMYEKFLDMAEKNDWKCLALPSAKGGHSYWKNAGGRIKKGGKSMKTAVGFVVDVHDKSTYIPLRMHGADRFPPDYDIFENEDYQEVPEELLPVAAKVNLWQMEDGNGRNDDLYSYILVLQNKLQLDKDTIRRILRNTNYFVFSEPLSDDELGTILRDEAFQKPVFFENKTFLFDKFAAFIKNNNHIVRINNQLHIYKDGIYRPGFENIESEMISYIPQLNRAKRSEVLAYLEILIRDNIKSDEANMLAFNNGLYNIVDDSFCKFTPDTVVTNKIKWDYNPSAYSELADGVLNKISCNDREIRLLLEECIGYCFYRRNELGKFFILIGDKSNGKSTFLSMIQNLLGDENIASLDLKELGDRFRTAELFGKLACIGDDIGDEFISDSSVLKKLVAGNLVTAERKGQNPFQFSNYSKLLFSANNIPRIKDKTGAVQRRMIIIPFNASFSKADPDFRPFIKYELQAAEVMEYLINIGIEGLKRILINKAFTAPDKVEEALEEYREINNPILGFFRECKDEDFQIENQLTNKVYKRYQEYCIANTLQPLGNIEFSRQISRVLKLKTAPKRVKGKLYRIYVKEEEEDEKFYSN